MTARSKFAVAIERQTGSGAHNGSLHLSGIGHKRERERLATPSRNGQSRADPQGDKWAGSKIKMMDDGI